MKERVKAGFAAMQRFMVAYKIWGLVQVGIPAVLSAWAVVEGAIAGWPTVAVASIGLVVLTQAALLLAAGRYLLNIPTAILERDPLVFGLAYEGIFTGYSGPQTPSPGLQLGISLHNSSKGPLAFVVERFSTVIGGMTASPISQNTVEIVIPMSSSRRWRDSAIPATLLTSLGNGIHNGSLEVEVLYGRFGEPKTRRYKLRLGLTVHLSSTNAHAVDVILLEQDVEA